MEVETWARSRLTRGATIASKWVLERPLGRGGMGEVWLATHQTLRQTVAIKILDRDAFPLEIAEEARSRFDLEARIAAKLARKTRHIVTVVDNGRDDDIDYLVMELLEGESLEETLAKGPLDPAFVAEVIRQAARGLMVAHAEGVIHRDLKPGNLYLTIDDNGDRLLKLLDFGIAKARDEREGPQSSHATRAGVIIGTAQFMSPEQARGRAIDARVDVWALAAVAYALLTGHAPFEGESDVDLLLKICTMEPQSPRSHRPELAAAVDSTFSRAFARRIDDRYQDARSFADALATALATTGDIVSSRAPESVVSYVATPLPMAKIELRGSRRPLLFGVGAIAVFALTGGALLLRRPPPPAPPASAAHREQSKIAPPPPPSLPPAVSTSSSAAPSASVTATTKLRSPGPGKPTEPVAAPEPTEPVAAPKPTEPVAAPKPTDKSEIL